jgi:Zn-finger nucleic acid-binding protein
MRCPRCEGEDTIQIEIHLKSDQSVEFYSCRRCEAKWWERGGDTISLDEVLNLAAGKESG